MLFSNALRLGLVLAFLSAACAFMMGGVRFFPTFHVNPQSSLLQEGGRTVSILSACRIAGPSSVVNLRAYSDSPHDVVDLYAVSIGSNFLKTNLGAGLFDAF